MNYSNFVAKHNTPGPMKSIYDISMDLARLRDIQEPIWNGQIERGRRNSQFDVHLGKRPTTLKDAKDICERNHARLNTAINGLFEQDRIYRQALEMLEEWVKVLRRGDMGDISPIMDEIFDTENLIKKMREHYAT